MMVATLVIIVAMVLWLISLGVLIGITYALYHFNGLNSDSWSLGFSSGFDYAEAIYQHQSIEEDEDGIK